MNGLNDKTSAGVSEYTLTLGTGGQWYPSFATRVKRLHAKWKYIFSTEKPSEHYREEGEESDRHISTCSPPLHEICWRRTGGNTRRGFIDSSGMCSEMTQATRKDENKTVLRPRTFQIKPDYVRTLDVKSQEPSIIWRRQQDTRVNK